MNTDNIAVVIPALNEAACIADVVRDALKQNACEVVVVDDFSTDGTAERAKQSAPQSSTGRLGKGNRDSVGITKRS